MGWSSIPLVILLVVFFYFFSVYFHFHFFLEKIVIEQLAVIHGVACNTVFSDALFSWLARVAVEAYQVQQNTYICFSFTFFLFFYMA